MRRFCVSVHFFIGFLSLASAVELWCFNDSADITKYQAATLEEPEVLINSTCLNTSLPTYLYMYGFKGKNYGPTTNDTRETVVKQGLYNFILVNWENEASSGSSALEISLAYAFIAIPNAISIGIKLGLALIRLIKYGLSLALHLVGHSMGAHSVCYAGRTMKEKGILVPHITGLDPAFPLYNNPSNPLMPMDETCANYVDCIHSDPGGKGLNQTCGTMDIWLNFEAYINGTNRQPGCPQGSFPMFSPEDLCSHNLCSKVYNQAFLNNLRYIAIKADNCSDWTSQNGVSNNTVYLGLPINLNATGYYYMSTNGVYPYGKGVDGMKP